MAAWLGPDAGCVKLRVKDSVPHFLQLRREEESNNAFGFLRLPVTAPASGRKLSSRTWRRAGRRGQVGNLPTIFSRGVHVLQVFRCVATAAGKREGQCCATDETQFHGAPLHALRATPGKQRAAITTPRGPDAVPISPN